MDASTAGTRPGPEDRGSGIEADPTTPDQARFAELTRSRCWELLGGADVGRLAWQAADGPQIFPVSYACYRSTVVFRTSPYGVLSELVRSTPVVLEVDDLDQKHRTGWTVLVHGRAQAVAEPQELVRMWSVDGAVPWAGGVRNLFIQITPTRVSGRLFQRHAD